MNDNLTNEKKLNFDEKLEQARKSAQRKTEDLSLDNALDMAAFEAEKRNEELKARIKRAHSQGLEVNSFKFLVQEAEEKLKQNSKANSKKNNNSKYDI